MRTSLNEIRQLEDYLLRQAGPEEVVLFEARLLLQPDLAEKAAWQQRAYGIIRAYGRKQLRAEIEAAHRKLFTAPEHEPFRRRIFRLFKPR